MPRLSLCGADGAARRLGAHEEMTTELLRRLRLAGAGATRWHDRIWAAGVATMRFLREDPTRARLLVALEGGGAEGLAQRDRLVHRLADLIDRGPGRNGAPGPRRSRATAEIAAAAIYRMLAAKVEAGAIERGEEFLPDLVYLAVLPYLGAEAAEGELAVQPLH